MRYDFVRLGSSEQCPKLIYPAMRQQNINLLRTQLSSKRRQGGVDGREEYAFGCLLFLCIPDSHVRRQINDTITRSQRFGASNSAASNSLLPTFNNPTMDPDMPPHRSTSNPASLTHYLARKRCPNEAHSPSSDRKSVV